VLMSFLLTGSCQAGENEGGHRLGHQEHGAPLSTRLFDIRSAQVLSNGVTTPYATPRRLNAAYRRLSAR